MNKLFLKENFSYTNIGKKITNQDFIIPNKNTKTEGNTYFILSDGVSTNPHGDIASRHATLNFSVYFDENPFTGDKSYFNEALQYVEVSASSMTGENSSYAEMATTCVLAYFNSEAVWICNCGDSPGFHFRDGKMIFRTKDHNYLNFLEVTGMIPKKEISNVADTKALVRAIKNASAPSALDVHYIDELKTDDIFLFCSDGVLESFSQQELVNLFEKKLPLYDIAETLIEKCLRLSSDNFSFHLISIQ